MLGGDLSLGSSKKASGRETELGALDSDAHHQSLGETRTLRNYDLFVFLESFSTPRHAVTSALGPSHLPYSRRAAVTTHDDFRESEKARWAGLQLPPSPLLGTSSSGEADAGSGQK